MDMEIWFIWFDDAGKTKSKSPLKKKIFTEFTVQVCDISKL